MISLLKYSGVLLVLSFILVLLFSCKSTCFLA
nr:MAG TPA: protein of unknown function (DUF4972) [Caudoviricetes sp.]